jgi:CRISPR-associated protein Csx10
MTASSSQITFNLQLRFVSDWHVGEGAGQPGHVDRLVRRDPDDDVPYVPAKTLTGIWRDACEAVAAGLDEGTGDSWARLTQVIFGDQPARPRETVPAEVAPPIPARLSVTAARFPASLRAHLRRGSRFAQGVTFIKPGVRVDPATGQAEDEALRFEEMARGGAVLNAAATLDASGVESSDLACIQALLWAGARTLDRIGGKRRRGVGRCEMLVSELNTGADRHLKLLDGQAPPVPPAARSLDLSVIADAPGPSTAESDWLAVPLVIRLRGPVVVPQRTLGNVVRSLDYVPGTYLLPHVTRALQGLIRDLHLRIARGGVRVTHANIDVAGGRGRAARGRPVPMAVHYDKEKGQSEGPIFNHLIAGDRADAQAKPCVGFVGAFDGAHRPVVLPAPMQQMTHATIEDEAQRPTQRVGGVYTYEAIRAGTVLRAEVRVRSALAGTIAKADPAWWKRLDGPVRLGIAKKDDYGAAELTAEAPEPCRAGAHVNGKFVLWLLSDVLVRDERLRASGSVEALRCEIARALWEPDCADVDARPARNRITIDTLFARSRRSEGWQAGWALPRPSYVGLAAGSCFTIHIENISDEDERKRLAGRVRALQLEGLGDRRAEGYGEIAIDDTLLKTPLSGLDARAVAPSPDLPPPPPISPNVFDYARLVEKAVWRDFIQRAAGAIGADAEWRRECFGWRARQKGENEQPKNSQLGNLKSMLTFVRTPKDLAEVLTWLANVEKRQPTAWPDETRKTLEKIQSRPDTVWTWLRSRDTTGTLNATITKNASREIEGQLWGFAARAVLFASIRAEQRAREAAERATSALEESRQ